MYEFKCYFEIMNRNSDCNRLHPIAMWFILSSLLCVSVSCSNTEQRDALQHRYDLIYNDYAAGKYEAAINAVDNIESSVDLTEYPDLACDFRFIKARSYQYNEDYLKAVSIYRQCLDFDYEGDDEDIVERIRITVEEAMLQMMNSYQSAGEPDQCVDMFEDLCEKPTPMIKKYCMRNLYAMYAYSLARNDEYAKAEEMVKKMFSTKMYKPTHHHMIMNYGFAASICFNNPEMRDSVISWGKKALLEAEAIGEDVSGLQWMTSMLGAMYKQTGEIVDAVEMYERSIDMALREGDDLGAANVYNSICDLYLYFQLPVQANEFAQKAIERNTASNDKNPMVVGASYIMKGRAMLALNHMDSALLYLNKADSCCHSLPYNGGQVDIDVFMGELLVNRGGQESVNQGIFRLKRVLSNSEASNVRAKAFFQLARAYDKLNQNVRCDNMLDSMSHILNTSENPIYITGANQFALEFYLKTSNNQKVGIYAKAMCEESEKNQSSYKTIAEHMLKYGLEKKEHELEFAENQLEARQMQIHFYVLLVIMLIFLLVMAILWYVYHRRLYNTRRAMSEQQITTLIENLREANVRGDNLDNKLKEFLNDKENWNRMELVTPASLREEGELKFRDNVCRMYPSFLPELRKAGPSITKREEILCMLILLGQNAEQIADVMCIAKNSVNIMRHRLRQKLDLSKDEQLGDAVKRLAGGAKIEE